MSDYSNRFSLTVLLIFIQLNSQKIAQTDLRGIKHEKINYVVLKTMSYELLYHIH